MAQISQISLYDTPFATPEAQADDVGAQDSGAPHAQVTVAVERRERKKGCIPRVDSLVLAEKRLHHCRKRPGHVSDQLHAHAQEEERPPSVFRRLVASVLQISSR